jgi:RNA polymerase-associated protein
MILYSSSICPFSQRCRFTLFEKSLDFEVKEIDLFNKPEDLKKYNPYEQVPILIERDYELYESNLINEYLDERFPHPQLMPGDPNRKAKMRLFLLSMERDLFIHVHQIEANRIHGDELVSEKQVFKAKKAIQSSLMQLAPSFNSNKRYAMSDDLSMIDVALAPLLWRLNYYDIPLPPSCQSLIKYAERVFSRRGFIDALSPAEKAMRR